MRLLRLSESSRALTNANRLVRWAVFPLLGVHGALLVWAGCSNSPTCDEVGHLAAGVYAWESARFSVYRVNPPLVRCIAAVPVLLANPVTDWTRLNDASGARPEWALGRDLIEANNNRRCGWFWYFVLARWAVIPFSLVGACVCYRWADELYGGLSGIVSLALWCFSPNVLAWGSTICADLPAAGLGVAACYVFWRWLKRPTWRGAVASGVVLGVAELTKTTWIVLFGLWPILWIVWWWSRFAPVKGGGWRREFSQLAVILLLGVYVINLGYGFEGSFRRLGDYTFVSRTLAGKDSFVEGGSGGNRYRDNWLGAIPVPVPENYLSGIDLQKRDFEEGMWSYLRGQWKHGGWWYYYLYAAFLKVPLGTWILGLLAMALSLSGFRMSVQLAGEPSCEAKGRACSAGWLNELTLLLPAVVVLLLVSSQTGFSRYFRYVLSCFPFVFIWISKTVRSVPLGHRAAACLGGAALTWSVGSSLVCYPHSMSYFNELVGGPTGGHYHLIEANIDWGQDTWYLKRWLDSHPEARPLHMACRRFVHPEHFGIDCKQPSEGPQPGVQYADRGTGAVGPLPGWYAMSIHRIHDATENYLYFLRLRPVAMAGYSIYIYHITLDEANCVREELGLPKVKAIEG